MADRARRRFEQLGVRGGKTGSITVVQRSNSDWLASFMTYDLGYSDEDACRLELIENSLENSWLHLHTPRRRSRSSRR